MGGWPIRDVNLCEKTDRDILASADKDATDQLLRRSRPPDRAVPDLLYDEMRRGNLPYVKVGRRRLITRQHLQQFLGVAS
jgi:hypothetical protein